MIRAHESSIAWKSGLLALMVHIVLLGALLFSFNWKAAHTIVMVSEVELWDALPKSSKPVKPKIKIPQKLKAPEPVVKPEEVKPEEIPPQQTKPEEAKPEIDIALENKKKVEEERKKQAELENKKQAELKEAELKEKKKQAELKEKQKEADRQKQLAALQQDMLGDLDPKKSIEDAALKKLQSDMLNENVKPSAPVNQGLVDEYIGKITRKIRGNVNKGFCSGNPQLIFKVNLLPNGEFVSEPRLIKSSGNIACDDAVERAIIASEPFPLPADPDALTKFRNLNLTFRPNSD